jgi:predicted nucleic acid-binding protein
MYLIDTSVLIDFFKGKETKQSKKLEKIIARQIPFGISVFTYQELLQGARDEKEFEKLKKYLSTQKIYYPSHETFEASAYLFFSCRKIGITIRSTIDALIATTAIENGLILLCSDRDFEHIANVVDLEIE